MLLVLCVLYSISCAHFIPHTYTGSNRSCMCIRRKESSSMARPALSSNEVQPVCYTHGGDDIPIVLHVQGKVYWKVRVSIVLSYESK